MDDNMLARFKENVKAYRENFKNLMASVGTPEHAKYAKIEEKLHAIDCELGYNLGFYAKCLCPEPSLACSACSGRLGRRLKRIKIKKTKEYIYIEKANADGVIKRKPVKYKNGKRKFRIKIEKIKIYEPVIVDEGGEPCGLKGKIAGLAFNSTLRDAKRGL